MKECHDTFSAVGLVGKAGDLSILTPLDFFLWGYVKDKVYATPVRDLRVCFIEAIESIPEDML